LILSPLGEKPSGINKVCVFGTSKIVGMLSDASFATPFPFTSGLVPVLDVSDKVTLSVRLLALRAVP
jgi:hypothetical protein